MAGDLAAFLFKQRAAIAHLSSRIFILRWWGWRLNGLIGVVFVVHGVYVVPNDLHVVEAAVSSAKVNRLPNTRAAVNAKRAASESLRLLNLNACSSR